MKKYLVGIKNKLFATYLYNRRFDNIDYQMGENNKKMVCLENNIRVVSDETKRFSEQLNLASDKVEQLSDKLNAILDILYEVKTFTEYHTAVVRNNIDIGIDKIKIAFLIHNVNAWTSVAELIIKLCKDDDFSVGVFSVNKKFPGQIGFSGEDDVSHFLDEKGIAHTRLGMEDSMQGLELLKRFNPDLIFRQSQWDQDFPDGFNSKYLTFTKLAFIPYEILSILKNVEQPGVYDTATDSLYHRRCVRVYCSNLLMKKQAEENSPLKGEQFLVVGHPKIDYLKTITPVWRYNDLNRKRVLWSPHHSIFKGWSDFGVFPEVFESMIELFDNNKDIDFVFCPHPGLVTLINSGNSGISAERITFFLNSTAELPNVYEHYGDGYAEVAAACDLIVTDGVSFLVEGQILGKDILFFDREDRRDFNKIGDIVSPGLHRINKCEDIALFLDDIRNGTFPSLRDNQIKALKVLFPENGNCSDNIIIDLKHSFLKSPLCIK